MIIYVHTYLLNTYVHIYTYILLVISNPVPPHPPLFSPAYLFWRFLMRGVYAYIHTWYRGHIIVPTFQHSLLIVTPQGYLFLASCFGGYCLLTFRPFP